MGLGENEGNLLFSFLDLLRVFLLDSGPRDGANEAERCWTLSLDRKAR